MTASAASRFAEDGFLVIPGFLDPGRVAAIAAQCPDLGTNQAGTRSLWGVAWAQDLAGSPEVRQVLATVGSPGAVCVRSIFFDKHAGANWKVPWHQDRTIAVAERIDVDGFGGWSTKEGVPHVRPPVAVLDGMVTVRIHLDDCDADNGPLRVVAGSHRHGVLSEADAQAMVDAGPADTLTCRAGDAILMKPLLLHASSPATSAGHRRVVHMEFAGASLPGGLRWYVEGHQADKV